MSYISENDFEDSDAADLAPVAELETANIRRVAKGVFRESRARPVVGGLRRPVPAYGVTRCARS